MIDADALLEKVAKIHPWEPYPSKYAQGIRHCMELVSLLIQDAPTIEPNAQPEIIRCENCEHYVDRYIHCDRVTWWNGNDDYCSKAERREE